MENHEAKRLVDSVYKAIEGANSLDEIKSNPEICKINMSRITDDKTYPRIKFKISREDLLEVGKLILDENHYLKSDLNLEKESVLTKLLYAIAWKNGDLKKLRHIIKGVLGEKPNYKGNEGIVLYYFGKYLTEPNKQSIIDQHVIRSFMVYNNNEQNDYNTLRIYNGVKEKNGAIVEEYINWIKDKLKPNVISNPDALYFIDKVLFSLGKMIKLSK